MTRPEDAAELARRRAAERRAQGAYADDLEGLEIEPTDGASAEKLLEWSLVEPDPDAVYSTRRLGAPITAAKQLLLRGLRQYLGQLVAEQNRLNIHLTMKVLNLESRVRELERELNERQR